MNPFLAVVDLAGGTVGLDAVTAALPALGQSNGEAQVLLDGSWGSAWVSAPELARPGIAHRHGILALGSVRLTDRRYLGAERRSESDLDVVVDHYLRRGTAAFRDLIGDFSFVLWDTRANRVVAARDALGVKSLFYLRRGDRIAVGSHLDCFEPTDFDRDFIGSFLIGLPAATERTIFADVSRLLPGHFLVAEPGRIRTEAYWSPDEFEAQDRVVDERAAVAEFRELFDDAVAAQLEDGQPAWSQLSGGLDSSSIVVVAEQLAMRGRVPGLLGTQTVVDTLSEGDETRYSDVVAARCRLPNERVTDYWAWQAGSEGPPSFADPRPFLPFYTRDQAMRDMVRRGGGRVLLSGYGADNYLAGSYCYIADLVRTGRLREAAGQLTDLAVATRRSFYDMTRRHVMTHLAPAWFRRRVAARDMSLPAWFEPEFAAGHGLRERLIGVVGPRRRGVFADRQAAEIGTIDLSLERGVFEDGLEVRYPFLHRPLVEYCLQLPVGLRFRPNRPKWILREAVGPALPDSVRNRQGKGGIDGRVVWSFERERPVLEALIAQSKLVDLGCLSGSRLAAAFSEARAGRQSSVGLLFLALSLETWFAVRSGWWSRLLGQAHRSLTPPNQREYDNVQARLQ